MSLLPVLALALLTPTASMALVLNEDRWATLTATTNLQHRNALRQRRAINPQLSTCGFLNGDPSKPRAAAPGYNCRVDAERGIWGFCPTSVIYARDCGFIGSCVDDHGCSSACGFPDKSESTTFTCTGAQYCTTALLTFGTNQIYSYLACGTGALVEHYLNSLTAETTTIAESTSRPGTEATKAATTRTSPTSLPAETSRSNSTTVTTSQSPSNSFAMATGSSSSQEQRSNDGTSNVSAIVGGAVGGIALVCASAIAIVYLVRRTRAVVPDRNDVPSELAGDTADSGCFNAAQEEVEPKALWMPSELSAVPVRRVELPG
ncbi:hypothetical protein ACCO45_011117 [Purpureocillium lilacinum]|uniref:Uncharacterized protein n=1 Tax=Purpureocillium lilacinum TaxID=33203 RepID=A0ACC4DI66_PURLI